MDRDLGLALPDGSSKSSPFGPAAIAVVGSAGDCGRGLADDDDDDDDGLLRMFLTLTENKSA